MKMPRQVLGVHVKARPQIWTGLMRNVYTYLAKACDPNNDKQDIDTSRRELLSVTIYMDTLNAVWNGLSEITRFANMGKELAQ